MRVASSESCALQRVHALWSKGISLAGWLTYLVLGRGVSCDRFSLQDLGLCQGLLFGNRRLVLSQDGSRLLLQNRTTNKNERTTTREVCLLSKQKRLFCNAIW